MVPLLGDNPVDLFFVVSLCFNTCLEAFQQTVLPVYQWPWKKEMALETCPGCFWVLWWRNFYFILFYFIISITVVPVPPYNTSPQTSCSPPRCPPLRQCPPCCPCPWIIYTCSLTRPSPSSSPSPPGHCQAVSHFRDSGSILLIYLFHSLGSTYRWDHAVFVFHCLFISLRIILSTSIHAVSKDRSSFFSFCS